MDQPKNQEDNARRSSWQESSHDTGGCYRHEYGEKARNESYKKRSSQENQVNYENKTNFNKRRWRDSVRSF